MRRLLLVTAALLAPAMADASPLYERTLMVRADQRCGLFTPPVRKALQAGAAQARSAALGAGAPADAQAAERRGAAKAASLSCKDPDLLTAAARVRAAYAGWGRQYRLAVDGWTAERRPTEGRWRLAQTVPFGPGQATLGLAPSGPSLSASFAGAQPSAVRLRLRDPAREPHATPGAAPAAGRGRVLFAGARTRAGARTVWRLPNDALDALAALDPRERVAAEFLFPDGAGRERVRSVSFAVGEAATALAFLEAGA